MYSFEFEFLKHRADRPFCARWLQVASAAIPNGARQSSKTKALGGALGGSLVVDHEDGRRLYDVHHLARFRAVDYARGHEYPIVVVVVVVVVVTTAAFVVIIDLYGIHYHRRAKAVPLIS